MCGILRIDERTKSHIVLVLLASFQSHVFCSNMLVSLFELDLLTYTQSRQQTLSELSFKKMLEFEEEKDSVVFQCFTMILRHVVC